MIIADGLHVSTLADRVATSIRCRRRRALGSLGWPDFVQWARHATVQAGMLRALEVMP